MQGLQNNCDITSADISDLILAFRTENYDKEQNCYSLIDFEMGMYGLPESDFARVLLDLIPEKLSDSFLDGYYGKSCHIKKDIRIIRLFLLMKIVEICSWSYKRSPDYYVKTFHTLENMYDQSDE